jgi:hypothetical protein
LFLPEGSMDFSQWESSRLSRCRAVWLHDGI